MMKRAMIVLAGVAVLAACDSSADVEPDIAEPVASPSAESTEEAGEDVAQATPARPANAITCTWPAQAGDTAEDLDALFADDARVQMVAGGEGTQIPGVVLWPDDDARRIEVLFADEARTQITNVRVFDGSQWQVGGLSTGSTLAEANAVNGTPFELFGFEWDYGGAVTDFKGGALADLAGCRALMSLGAKAETDLPMGVLGDVLLTSDDDRLPQDGIVIWELGLVFPEE